MQSTGQKVVTIIAMILIILLWVGVALYISTSNVISYLINMPLNIKILFSSIGANTLLYSPVVSLVAVILSAIGRARTNAQAAKNVFWMSLVTFILSVFVVLAFVGILFIWSLALPSPNR